MSSGGECCMAVWHLSYYLPACLPLCHDTACRRHSKCGFRWPNCWPFQTGIVAVLVDCKRWLPDAESKCTQVWIADKPKELNREWNRASIRISARGLSLRGACHRDPAALLLWKSAATEQGHCICDFSNANTDCQCICLLVQSSHELFSSLACLGLCPSSPIIPVC